MAPAPNRRFCGNGPAAWRARGTGWRPERGPGRPGHPKRPRLRMRLTTPKPNSDVSQSAEPWKSSRSKSRQRTWLEQRCQPEPLGWPQSHGATTTRCGWPWRISSTLPRASTGRKAPLGVLRHASGGCGHPRLHRAGLFRHWPMLQRAPENALGPASRAAGGRSYARRQHHGIH